MSTPPVVGTCTDCIVSLPVQPTNSLVFTVGVKECNNLVLKHVAQFETNYPATDITEMGVNLAPGGSYTTTAVTAVVVNTNAPLQVTVSLAGNAFTFNVNNILVLDDSYDSVTLTNPAATGGATATVFLAYAYLVPAS